MTLDLRDVSVPVRLAGVTARLHAGQVTAVCGPNGAGKSTLLAVLGGLLRASCGSVDLDDLPLTGVPARERARRIGFLPQSPDSAWDMTVGTLVGLGRLPWQGAPLHRAHGSTSDDASAVTEALAAMDLSGLADRPMSSLSGGEQARAHLARVLAGQPQWLLADEPLANLDLGHAAALMATLRAQAAAGCGVVIVVHDLATAMNHADRVLVLERGRLVADGTPETALRPELLRQVWGVSAQWLGERGSRALSFAPPSLSPQGD